MLAFIPREAKRILDVGCGRGNFSRSIKARQETTAWGIEYDTRSAKAARAHMDRVIIGDAAVELPKLTGTFDCIIFNDVLEHLYDPEAILRTAGKKLTRGGVIVASIPNIRQYHTFLKCLFTKDWQYTHDGVLDRSHIRFFTLKSIQRMFNDLNFETITIQGVNPVTFVEFDIWNTIFFGYLSDTRYQQYACVVRPRMKG